MRVVLCVRLAEVMHTKDVSKNEFKRIWMNKKAKMEGEKNVLLLF